MVTKSTDAGSKSGKGSNTEHAKEGAEATVVEKAAGSDQALIDLGLRDIVVDIHLDHSPADEISASFQQAFLDYAQMSEKEFVEEAKEALAKAIAEKGPNFLNLEFEQLFDVELQEGGSDAMRIVNNGSEGGVNSLERFLSIKNVFSVGDEEELYRVESQPQNLAFNTAPAYPYSIPPTQSPDLRPDGPRAPPLDIPPPANEEINITETALNTQPFVLIESNIFIPSIYNNFTAASTGSGLQTMDAFFNVPARAGSSEVHTATLTILTTPEGNVFTFDRVTGDYSYQLNNAVLHLQSVWGSNYVDALQEVFTDRFVYSITDTTFQTAVGAISVFILDGHPLATDQTTVAITEADIQTVGSNQSPTAEQLPGSLIFSPDNIFGADGGKVSNVVLTSATSNGVTNATGNTVISSGTITVTDSEGNTFVIDQATGSFAYNLNNAYTNINHQPTVLVFTFTFTDSDNDSITKTITFTINDDNPVGTVTLTGAIVATDETPGLQAGVETALPAGALGQTTVLHSTLVNDTTIYGADGAGSRVYNLNVTNGTSSGFKTPDGSTDIVLFKNGAVVEGHVGTTGGQLAFTVSVNANGDITLTQYLAVQHTPESGANQLSSGMTPGVLTLTETVTDSDGDFIAPTVDLGTVIKFYDDAPTGTISLNSGVFVVTDETPGVQSPESSASGFLGQTTVSYASLITDTTIYGSDGVGSKVYSLVATDGTASGYKTPDGSQNIVLFNNGGNVEGHVGTTGGALAFVVHVDSSTGAVTLTQYLAVQHTPNTGVDQQSNGMTAGVLQIRATVTDADGDVINPTTELGTAIRFRDDAPTGTISLNSGVFVVTDETPGIQSPESSASGFLGQTTVSYASLIADTTIYGSDGAGSKVYSLVATDGTASGYKTPDGSQNIVLFNNGGNVEGHVGTTGGALAFVVHVDSSTGAVTLTQYLAVQHTPNTGVDQQSNGMTAGVLQIRATVTDADGDQIIPTTELGTAIRFNDDAPTGTISLNSGVFVVTDETPGVQAPESSATGFLGQTTVSYASLITDTTIFGSDGAGSKVFSLVAVDGTNSGYKTPDGSVDIKLYNVGGVIEGHAGLVTDALVFKVSVNASTGAVTLTQYLAVQHSPDTGADQQSNGMTAGVLQIRATVTDADGDQITPTTELGTAIRFNDDAPTGTISLNSGVFVVTDETPGVQSPESSATGFLGQTTVSYASLITDTTIYGSDGAGTKVFSLVATDGTASGYKTPDGSQNIVLFNNGGNVEGHVGTTGGALAFVVHVDSSTGAVTLTQYLAVQHSPDTGADQQSNGMTAGVLQIRATVTDADGDVINPTTELGTAIRFRDDAPTGTISLNSGVFVVTDETPGIQSPESSATGFLGQTTVSYASLITDTTIYGSDGAGSKVYSLVATDGTASGYKTPDGSQDIVLFNNGGDIEGHVGTTGGALVFIVSINSGTGEVTLTQYSAVQHTPNTGVDQQSNGMTAGVLQIRATVTDADGDQITPTTELGTAIRFNDDAPTGTISLNSGVFVVTDETPGVQSPESSATGFLGQTTVSYASLITDTTIYGSDGVGSKVYSLVATNGTASGYKTPDGSQNIVLFNNGGNVEGHVGTTGGALAFVVHVDSSTGAVTLTQYLAVQHSPDTGADQQSNGMTAGVLQIRATVTDADGDQITPTTELGTAIRFNDDAPTGTISLNSGVFVVTDETPGVQSPESSASGFLGQTTVSYASLITDTTIYGSDGAGSKVYSLVATDGTASGYKTPDGSQNIVLFNNGGDIEGHVGTTAGALVFVVHVDSSTGAVTLTQYLAVQHSPDTGADQQSNGMTAGVLQIRATVTDADGDQITPTTELGTAIRFNDDAPTGTITLKPNVDVAVDETPGIGVGQPDTNNVGLGQSVVTYASLVNDTTSYGSDGAGTKVFSLLATDGTDSGFKNADGTQNIYLFNNGATVEGRIANSGGAVVFTVSVNSSTGDVTLTQILPVQHLNTLDPNDVSVMSSDVLSLVATVTDADGDSIAPTIDLGSVIKFYDDAPTGTLSLNANAFVVTDETPGVQTPEDSASGSLGETTVPYATLITDTTIFGSDGAGSKVFSLVATDGTASGYKTPDGSQDIVLFNNGGDIEGHVGTTAGALAFVVHVDSSTGAVTLTQYLAVQHSPDSGPDQLSDGMTTGVLSIRATVTDADGDVINPTAELGTAIRFHDDAPIATDINGGTLNEANLPTGSSPDGSALTTSGTLLNGSGNVFGSDGGSVSNVTIAGGNTVVDALLITVTTAEGNVLVVTRATGTYTYTLNAPIDNDSDANPSTTVGTDIFNYTFTDNDGDTANANLTITINDDVPTGTMALQDAALVATDESSGLQLGVETSVPPGTLGQTIVSYSSIVADTTIYGSDGAGSKVFSLVATDNTVSGFKTPDGSTDIILFNNGSTVEGRIGSVSGDVAFSVEVNSSTGAVTLTQYSAVEHSTIDPNELSGGMLAGVLLLRNTTTDADGDVITPTVDLGSVIKFYDDGPTAANPEAIGNEDDASIAINLSATGSDDISSFRIATIPSASEGVLYDGATPLIVGDVILATGNAAVISFVPALNFNGPVTFNYVAIDNDGDEDTGQVDITVNPVNDAPVANAVSASGDEDTSIAVGLSGSDIDGTVANFRIDILPDNGLLYLSDQVTQVNAGDLITASGNAATLYFVPDSNFNGNVTFNYVAIDNDVADSAAAQVDITVNSVNDAPVANAVSASGDEDATSIPVTLSGSDIDGTVDNFRIYVLPNDGILYTDALLTDPVIAGGLIAATGNSVDLYFVPNANFFGEVDFDYNAIDNNGLASQLTAHVDIAVESVNDAPLANAASATGDENAASIEINLSGTDIDGIVSSFRVDTLPSDGVLYKDAGLTMILGISEAISAVSNSAPLYFVPDTNFVGIVTFDYYAIDDANAYSLLAAQATITVNNTNSDPIASDNSYTYNIISGELAGNLISDVTSAGPADSDPDGDILSITAINGTPYTPETDFNLDSLATINVTKDGSFTYTGLDGLTDEFTYTITDGHGGFDTAKVYITAAEVPPMILDLNNNNKIDLISSERSDVTLNSFEDTHGTNHMGWVQPGDGILVYDYQGDGKVTNIDEIALTLHSDAAKTDLDALRIAFDSNHDGVFDAKDEKFNQFGVWQDKNSDGLTDAGEYHTLTQMGIISINVNSDHQVQMIEGNTLHGFTSYTTADGVSHMTADVALNVAPATQSVAIESHDVIGEQPSIDFSSVASLPPLASDNNHVMSLTAQNPVVVVETQDVAAPSPVAVTQQIEQQHQETPLS